MYLENWIQNIVRRTLETERGFRTQAKRASFERITRSDVETYQAFKLRETLRYVREKSSFYRGWFNASGLSPEDIRSAGDLPMLPFTEPGQLAEVPYRFLCVSQADIARPYTFVTSGTTGPKKKVFWSRSDLERITDFMAAGIGTVATRDDIVQIILPDGRPNSQAELLYEGVRKFGATPAVSSIDIGARELLNSIEEIHSTVIFGYTRRLFRLSKELQSSGDLREKGVRILFLAAEYLPDAMRKDLQQIWNCRVHTHYGLTEMGLGVAVECSAGNGYHFNEAGLLVEIVDPGTGKPVQSGKEGELVFTTLDREAMPLIRYRTHDISRLIVEPCTCGASTLLKIDKVKKRLESIATVGDGDEIYPALFDDVLFEVPSLIDYQVVVKRQGGKDRLDFTVEMMEERESRVSEIRSRLLSAPVVANNIAAGRMVEPRVETVAPGALRSVGREKRMIVDRR